MLAVCQPCSRFPHGGGGMQSRISKSGTYCIIHGDLSLWRYSSEGLWAIDLSDVIQLYICFHIDVNLLSQTGHLVHVASGHLPESEEELEESAVGVISLSLPRSAEGQLEKAA